MQGRFLALWSLFLVAALGCSSPTAQGDSDLDTHGDQSGTDTVGDQFSPEDSAELAHAELAPEDALETTEVQEDTGDHQTPPDNAELLLLAREYLARGESIAAFHAYKHATALVPDDPEALLGTSLAQIQMWTGMLDTGLGALQNGDLTADDAFSREDGPSGAAARLIFNSIESQSRRQLTRLDTLKEMDLDDLPHLRFPVTFQHQEFMVLDGEWDRADVYAISAFTRTLYGFVLLLNSQDLSPTLYDFRDILEADGSIAQKVADLLRQHPQFLLLDSQTGETHWLQIRSTFLEAAQDGLHAIELSKAEDDDQSDDVMAVVDAQNPAGATAVELRGAFFEAESDAVQLLWDGPDYSAREALEALRDHLADEAANLNLATDVLIHLAVFLDLLRKTVGVNYLLDTLGVDLPESIGGLLAMLPMNDVQALPTLLPSVLPLLGVVPEGIEMDLSAFTSRPIGLRTLLPATHQPPLAAIPDFVTSRECLQLGVSPAPPTPGLPLEITLFLPHPSIDATPGPGNDEFLLSIQTGDSGAPEAPTDHEDLVLTEHPDFPGLFQGILDTTESLAEGTDNNGNLEWSQGAPLVSAFGDPDAEPPVPAVQVLLGDDIETFHWTVDCVANTTWDGSHFGGLYGPAALLLADPPAAADETTDYPVVEPDGVDSPFAYPAMGSPSFNGLLHADLGLILGNDEAEEAGFELGFLPLTPRSFGRIWQEIRLAIDQF